MIKELDIREVQARLLYSLIVAGKSAKFAERATKALLVKLYENGRTPFAGLRRVVELGLIHHHLRDARTGNYQKLARGFTQLAESGLNLRTCTPQDLERVHGIGPKTSRFFVLWTRPGYRCAALDVHVLRWLRAQGHKAPASTPQSRKAYARLEEIFLKEADRRGKTPRELDSEIWDAAKKGTRNA